MTRTLSIFFLLFLGLLSLGSAAIDVKGRIVWNDVCSGYSQLGQARVVLDNEKYSGGVLRDGSFSIPNVSSGTYLLSVISHDYLFDQIRLDVTESEATVEARPYVSGTPMNPSSTILLPYPVSLTPRQKFSYFVPRDSFNVMGMLKNPMILMMIAAGGMVFAMPYLMKNLDPEALEEFKKEQAKMTQAQSALQNGDFKSGFSALMAAASGQEQSASQPSDQGSRSGTQSTPAKNRGKGKRR